MSKYRMAQIAVMDDNTYCRDFRISEYQGKGIRLYVTHPEGDTYEYYLGNRKGDLAIVRREWNGKWEWVDAIPGCGDETPVKAIHKGKGVLKIIFESFPSKYGSGTMYRTLDVQI